MEDAELVAQISALVDEEHRLEHESREEDPERLERLRVVKIALDQCWDLLRQRRARRAAGLDPEGARLRDASTVEGHQQ
jgi:hypothetical protein